MTDKELAQELDVSPRTIAYWREQGCTDRTVEGLREWRANNKRPTKSEPTPASGLQEQLLRAQIAKTRADAEAKNRANDELVKTLVDAAEARQVWAIATGKVKARLERMPREAAADLPGTREELVERLTIVVRAVLLDLSQITA